MGNQIAFREALNQALMDEMSADEKVFVFGLDVTDHKRIFGSTFQLPETFGAKRCFLTPLSEDAMTGVALGAALSGLRPVHVHIRVDFLLLAMNQIANMMTCARYLTDGKLKTPIVIRAVIGRGWGQGAQHSKTMQSVFAHLPGLKVVMPTTPQDAYSLLRASIQDDGPVIFMEHRWLYDAVGEVDKSVTASLGRAEIRQFGEHLTVIASGWMTVEALKAAEILGRRDVRLEVVDVRTISPLDLCTMVDSVRKTGSCIVADYDWLNCGLSAEIAAQISNLCFRSLRHPVERLGFAAIPCPTTRPLENLFYPSAIDIIRTAEKMLNLSETDLSKDSFFSWEERFKGPF